MTCARLHKGNGESLLFYGANIIIENDTSVSDYNITFAYCKLYLSGGFNTNRKFTFDNCEAHLESCVCTDLEIVKSHVTLKGCYLWNTPTLKMDRSTLLINDSSSAATVTGTAEASIIVNDLPTPMSLTLTQGAQHFI